MSKNHVKFEKEVVYGEDKFRTVIYAIANENPNFEDITVDIFITDAFNNDYTYKTSRLRNDENRYIIAIHEAINDYLHRQYKDDAVSKLNEWDGNIKNAVKVKLVKTLWEGQFTHTQNNN